EAITLLGRSPALIWFALMFPVIEPAVPVIDIPYVPAETALGVTEFTASEEILRSWEPSTAGRRGGASRGAGLFRRVEECPRSVTEEASRDSGLPLLPFPVIGEFTETVEVMPVRPEALPTKFAAVTVPGTFRFPAEKVDMFTPAPIWVVAAVKVLAPEIV